MMFCSLFKKTLSYVLLLVFISKIVCAAPYTPQSILPDGVDTSVSVNPYTGESGQARKGTIAATINNITKLNQLFVKPLTKETKAEIEAITAAVSELLPSLRVVGMFDFFTAEEWIGQGDQQGRLYVALLYLNLYPQAMSPAIQCQLKTLSDTQKLHPLVAERLKAISLDC